MSTAGDQATAAHHSTGFTIQCKIHFKNGRRGRKQIHPGEAPVPRPVEPGSVPRISKLVALAIHLDLLLRKGVINSYADLARLGHVSRTRITQIMNLLNLAPDIQEDILFLPRTLKGRDPITERDVRPILAEVDWTKQRSMWVELNNRL